MSSHEIRSAKSREKVARPNMQGMQFGLTDVSIKERLSSISYGDKRIVERILNVISYFWYIINRLKY